MLPSQHITFSTPNNTAYYYFIIICLITIKCSCCEANNLYTNESKLYEDLVGPSSGYNTVIRPSLNRHSPTGVIVGFSIIAILELDSFSQRFSANGFLELTWTDELLTWNPDHYGGISYIRPVPAQIWRPRLALSNTVGDRDLFEDDYYPVTVRANGSVSWLPGSLFPSTCSLDMTKYPFDTQTCSLEFYTIGRGREEINFVAPTPSKVDMLYYHQNGAFDIPDTSFKIFNNVSGSVAFYVTFTLKRLPAYFVLNVILPISTMSFLSIMTYIIPIESGEKLGYSTTMFLTISLFMGAIDHQLPTSSTVIPLITVHIAMCMLVSGLSVFTTIYSIHLSHWVEKEKSRRRQELEERRCDSTPPGDEKEEQERLRLERWTYVSERVDKWALWVSLVVWGLISFTLMVIANT